MRWYRLRIGEGLDGITDGLSGNIELQSQSSSVPRNNNPTPLNIAFNVTVNVGLSAQVGSVVKIYNLSQEFFVYLKNQVGKPIQLEAGFDANSPMIQKLGYPEIPERTIINSNIQSVMGNFETLEPWVAVSVGPYANTEEEQQKLQQRLEKVSKAHEQTSTHKFQIEPQKTMKDTLHKAVSNFLDDSWHIRFTNTLARMALAPATQGVFTAINTLSQLLSLMRNKLGVGCALDYTNNVCVLYKCTPGLTNSDLRDYADVANITGGGIKIISPTEFLSQPNAEGFNTLSAMIALRADLHLGDMVILEGTIPTMSSFEGIDTFISKGVNDNLKLFAPGVYMIMGINHNGEFYGTAPDSWSTQLKLVLVDSKMLANSAANEKGAVELKVVNND